MSNDPTQTTAPIPDRLRRVSEAMRGFPLLDEAAALLDRMAILEKEVAALKRTVAHICPDTGYD